MQAMRPICSLYFYFAHYLGISQEGWTHIFVKDSFSIQCLTVAENYVYRLPENHGSLRCFCLWELWYKASRFQLCDITGRRHKYCSKSCSLIQRILLYKCGRSRQCQSCSFCIQNLADFPLIADDSIIFYCIGNIRCACCYRISFALWQCFIILFDKTDAKVVETDICTKICARCLLYGIGI